MDMPRPTEGHKKLERLAGSWTGEEQMYPSPWDPKGGVATGRTEARVALGGFCVISDYRQERNGTTTFAGHGVWTFDPKQDLYTLHWFDSMGSPPEVFTGRFAGEVLTVAHGGPGMHARLTYDITDPQELRSAMEMSPDGGAWNKLFDGRYRRA
jgi:uncharacterized protein YodC (DUF2158 family)